MVVDWTPIRRAKIYPRTIIGFDEAANAVLFKGDKISIHNVFPTKIEAEAHRNEMCKKTDEEWLGG